jgi:hypothetical protein
LIQFFVNFSFFTVVSTIELWSHKRGCMTIKARGSSAGESLQHNRAHHISMAELEVIKVFHVDMMKCAAAAAVCRKTRVAASAARWYSF